MKRRSDLFTYLQYVGLVAAKMPATIKPLLFGGKFSFQYAGNLFTGPVYLYIGQGGLRNREVPSTVKEIFKKSIMPALVDSLPALSPAGNHIITLQFREGELLKIN